jgi:hypothetical protein
MRRALPLAILLAGLAAAPARADTTIAPLVGATPVRALGSMAVWSSYDPAVKDYRLTLLANGAVSTVAVAPRKAPFEADLGTDAAGNPVLVYSRCTRDGPLARGCDLYQLPLGAGGAERAIAGANTAREETHPTLSKGRLVWARSAGRGHVRVYERMLAAPRSTRSRALNGVLPRRSCHTIDRRCTAVREVAVTELELSGGRLAVTTTFATPSGGGIHQGSLRLADVRTGRSREIAFQVTGLSGQSLVGPSFAGSRLGWYLSCLGDPAACGSGGRGGPWVYDTRTRRYAHASDSRPADGFALLRGSRAYVARSTTRERCTYPPGEPPATGCELALTDPIAFRAARAPRG